MNCCNNICKWPLNSNIEITIFLFSYKSFWLRSVLSVSATRTVTCHKPSQKLRYINEIVLISNNSSSFDRIVSVLNKKYCLNLLNGYFLTVLGTTEIISYFDHVRNLFFLIWIGTFFFFIPSIFLQYFQSHNTETYTHAHHTYSYIYLNILSAEGIDNKVNLVFLQITCLFKVCR